MGAVRSLRRQDLALYKVRSGQPRLQSARLARDLPLPGDPVRVAGFSDLPFIVASDAIRVAGVSVYSTTLTSVAADAADSPLRLYYPGGAWPGMSGGPVYNARNEVIGIHTSRATGNVQNLLNQSCDPGVPGQNCWGNAIGFDLPAPGNQTRRQIINVNHDALKSILDNFGWATSVHAIPAGWRVP